MLPNWSAYFDSKTSTQSFYEVDYRAIILKCGPSLYENLSLKPATNISNSTLTEFKGQFGAMLKILKENVTEQQPWKDIKKVSKVIENVVAYVYIEGAYLKRVQMDATDLQVSPSFSFTIQRFVRLAKDLHLLCIYAKKKETEEFKETRRVLKEAMRGVRKSALHFLKEYSIKQEEQTIDPIREILMAQFLQLVKFLVNFTKFEDHQAYVTYCSSGSTTKNLPDIWKMTDVSVRQATKGASSIMIDSRKDVDNASNLSSLMRIPSQGRRSSVVSTVHELCSLGDILVKKRDFTQGSTKSYNDYKGSIGDLEGLGESTLGFRKQKGFRRRTADEQDRPDSRLLKESYKLYGNNTGGADGTKGPKRSNSITVPSQFSRNEQSQSNEVNFVIEEQSGEASPKKCGSRKLDTDKIEEKSHNVLKIWGQGKTEEEHYDEVAAEEKVPEDQEGQEDHENQEVPEDNHEIKEVEEENDITHKEQGTEINNTQELTLGVMGVVLPEEIFNSSDNNPEKNEVTTVTENTVIAEGNSDNLPKEETPRRIAQFKRKLRAVSVGRHSLLQLVLKHEAPNVDSLEVTPRHAMSIEGSPVVIARSEKRHNTIVATGHRPYGEIETAGLPPPKQENIIVETAALNIPRSRRESLCLVRKRRSSSLDGLPKRSHTRDKRPHRKSGGYKKPEEDFSFQPLPVMERRKQFLAQTFGAQNKVGVERSLQDSYGLFHQRYERIYKERVYDIRRTTEFGKKRLACIPYVVPESLMFFEKVQEVRRQEAKEKSNKVTKNRIPELWEKVRQAVKLKTFLWKLDCQKDMEFPTSTKNDNSDLLKSLTKNSKGSLKFFRYTTKDNKEVRYVGPVRNLREIKHKDLHNGSFLPEENRECEDEFYALETNLRLARLAFNRRSLWGAAFSFRGRGGPSVESRDFSRDVSREASRDVSREDSRENSGSALSSTKRGSLLKTLFNTSAENSVILSPTNRSNSEGREQSWSASKSKPSLFKSLLRLHPVNEPSSAASPRTTRSRASSKTSLKDCINNSCSSSPRGTSGPLSCPKKPSLFKTLFKLNAKDSDGQKSGRSSREPNTPASAGWKTSRD